MKKPIFITLGIMLVVIVSVVIWQMSFQRNHQSSTKLNVATSFYPLYYFTSRVGGSLVDVTNITPSGAEPHDYDPTTQEIAHIESGDLLVLNGGVEAWGDRIKASLQGGKVKVIVAGQGLLTKQLTEEGRTTADPHIWLDPLLAKQEARAISKGLSEIDPRHRSIFEANEAKLAHDLDQLDSEYKTGLKRCQQKDIITSHIAFAYLASQYGLNQVAIAGISPDEEPSTQQLAEVTNFAKSHHVKYIFFESLVSPKLSETIANEVGAQTLVLDPIEGVSREDMQNGKNYFSIMRENLKNLKVALECAS